MVIANVFGAEDFPVCNETQKAQLEAAYKDAIAYEDAHGVFPGCMCDLIIALLSDEEPPRGARILAAFAVAKQAYEKKAALAQILSMLEGVEMMSERGNA